MHHPITAIELLNDFFMFLLNGINCGRLPGFFFNAFEKLIYGDQNIAREAGQNWQNLI